MPRPQTIINTSRVFYTNKLSAQTTKIRIKLNVSHTLLSAIGFQTGGFVFYVARFSLGGGAGKHRIVGAAGSGGGVSSEEFGVDKGGGG